MMDSGYIYLVYNTINGKRYVGQSRDWTRIRTYMGSGTWIMRAIRKYGKSQFHKIVLQYCLSIEDLNVSEQRWIRLLRAQDPVVGYNLNEGGGGQPGPSESVRSVMSQKAIGNQAGKGNAGSIRGPMSPEVVEKIRQKAMGNCRAKGFRNSLGWHPSEAHKAALRRSRLGIPLTEEHKTKIGQAQKGRQFSEQTKSRMSESAKSRHQRERT